MWHKRTQNIKGVLQMDDGIMEEEKRFYVDAKDILEKKVNLEKIIQLIKASGATLYINNGKLFTETQAGKEADLFLLQTMLKEGIEVTTDDFEEWYEKNKKPKEYLIVDSNAVIKNEINIEETIKNLEGTGTSLFLINLRAFSENSITKVYYQKVTDLLRKYHVLYDYSWEAEGPQAEDTK